MFTFNINDNFEPTSATKRLWLFTYKESSVFAGVTLPGFFQTSRFQLHLWGFILIFILEGLATYFTWELGANLVAILLAMVLDFLCAYLAHRKHADLCIAKNERIVATNTIEVQRFDSIIKKIENRHNLFKFVIYLLCAVKISFYFLGTAMPFFDPTSFAVVAFYCIAALLHITCTGYFFAAINFTNKIQKEYASFIESKGVKHKGQQYFSQPVQTGEVVLDECSIQNNKHRIRRQEKQFYFETTGILTDADLVALITAQQNNQSKQVVAIEGIKHQLLILQRDPIQNN